ncbi:hypothetical protein O1V64_16565 [Rouxiella badensis]|nr:hypothetical protein O1V64_16565 [Rouxiella badensis]
MIRHMAPELAVLQPGDQGMHMVLWLHKGIRDVEVVQYAIAAGVSVRAVSPMYSAGNERSGLILGLGGFTDEAIIGAVKKLAAIIQRIAP